MEHGALYHINWISCYKDLTKKKKNGKEGRQSCDEMSDVTRKKNTDRNTQRYAKSVS